MIEPKGVVRVPRLLVRWDAAKYGLDGKGLRLRVLNGDPRMMMDDMAIPRTRSWSIRLNCRRVRRIRSAGARHRAVRADLREARTRAAEDRRLR